jgi:hypothetical protein
LSDPDKSTGEADAGSASRDVRRHLRFGWIALVCFATIGLTLEALSLLGVGAYVAAANETRRLMWTLGHAHGVLLSLVNIAFALTIRAGLLADERRRRLAGRALMAGTILLPGGFLAGGVVDYGGDPGPGIIFGPNGELLLLAGLFLGARGTRDEN